jgi:putative transposase
MIRLDDEKYQCQFLFVLARHQTQLSLRYKTWGGARAGAGRPPKGKSAGVSHLRRPSLSHRHPLHVTLRLTSGVPSLRKQALFLVVRSALARGQERFGFRLVHFSVQSNHLHLIAEAADRRALSRGVQGLSVRVARAVNSRLQRKGRLFADRYHARALTTPRTVRYALRYVLLNARKHQHASGTKQAARPAHDFATTRRSSPGGVAGRPEAPLPFGFIDSRSSAAWFPDFLRGEELAFGASQVRTEWRATSALDAPVVKPKTWLLRVGYLRHGAFDIDDVPGA